LVNQYIIYLYDQFPKQHAIEQKCSAMKYLSLQGSYVWPCSWIDHKSTQNNLKPHTNCTKSLPNDYMSSTLNWSAKCLANEITYNPLIRCQENVNIVLH